MSGPKLRDMRAVDMVKHSRWTVPKFAGVVAELEGQEIGCGCIVIGHQGRPFLSLQITDELRRFPTFLHRVALKLTRAGVTQLGTIYAIADNDEPGADKWLRRLGFTPTDEVINGERVYRNG
jgi:hypothetical protein